MTPETAAPPKPISSLDLPWTEWSDVPRFGVRYRALAQTAIGDDYHVGVAIEELAPGKGTAPARYLIFEEEHVFVLEGTLTCRIGDQRYPMQARDYVCFPAGQRLGHCLMNEGNAPCRYVIVGENNPSEVAVYTDSNKVLVRALGRRAIFDMDALRGYWHREETGLANGDKPLDEAAIEPVDAKPRPPIASGEVAWESQAAGRSFGGRSKHLTGSIFGENYHVGVLIESPDPGKRLWPLHYHMLEEEHVLVLEGELTLLLGDERHVMRPGDYVAFPAGMKIGHSFLNSGPGPASYLLVGERNANDVCVYPHSNKMAVNPLRIRDCVFGMEDKRGYWDGEAD